MRPARDDRALHQVQHVEFGAAVGVAGLREHDVPRGPPGSAGSARAAGDPSSSRTGPAVHRRIRHGVSPIAARSLGTPGSTAPRAEVGESLASRIAMVASRTSRHAPWSEQPSSSGTAPVATRRAGDRRQRSLNSCTRARACYVLGGGGSSGSRRAAALERTIPAPRRCDMICSSSDSGTLSGRRDPGHLQRAVVAQQGEREHGARGVVGSSSRSTFSSLPVGIVAARGAHARENR